MRLAASIRRGGARHHWPPGDSWADRSRSRHRLRSGGQPRDSHL